MGYLDDLAAGDEVDDRVGKTNELLARLVAIQAQQAGIDDVDLGYYSGGESTASTSSTDTTSEEAPRVHFGRRVAVETSDIKDDPKKVALPFEADHLDLRDWSGQLYVAFRDPQQYSSDSLWYEVTGAEAPITELAGDTSTVWLASDGGTAVSPLIDAWLHGVGL